MAHSLGVALIALGLAGVGAQWLFGLNDYANAIAHAVLGQYATETVGTSVGAGVIYLTFYFIAVAGLALVAIARR